jgi:hypothetical protein
MLRRITAKQLQCYYSISYNTAKKEYHNILAALSKGKNAKLTLFDLARFEGIPPEQLSKMIQ